MGKKGQINLQTAPSLILIITFTIMLAVTSAIVLNAMLSTDDATGSLSLRDDNETFTALNATAVDFATSTHGYYSDSRARLITCQTADILNASNLANITDQFTISGCEATLTNIDLNGTLPTVNFTFTITTYTDVYNITHQGELSLENFSNQLPQFGSILGAALIIAVIVGAFAFILMRGSGQL